MRDSESQAGGATTAHNACTIVLPAVKSDNPGIAFGEIGKKVGALWAALSEKDKVSMWELRV